MKSAFWTIALAILTISLAVAQTGDAGASRVLVSTASTPLVFLPDVAYTSGGAADAKVGDFSGDGKHDIVTIYANKVGFLPGNGDGTFGAEVTSASGAAYPIHAVVGDLNHDSKLDIAILDQFDSQISVLLGNGNGTFKAPVNYAGGGYYASNLEVADLNGDGYLDLITSSECQHSDCGGGNNGVGVLLGNGNGTFKAAVTYPGGGFSSAVVAVGDVNGDGHPDLVVFNGCTTASCLPSASSVGVLLGNGDGTFQAPVTRGVPYGSRLSMVLADTNQDGHLDIVLGAGPSGGSAPSGVLLGNGNGTFQAMKALPAPLYEPFAVADVNGDGKVDIVSIYNPYFSFVDVFSGKGNGTFQAPLRQPLRDGILRAAGNGLVLADVNGDGKPDIVTGGNNAAVVMLNNHGAAAATIGLASNLNPVNYNTQTVTYTATVAQSGAALNGTVTFFDGQGTSASQLGQGPLGTVPVVNNKASFSIKYALPSPIAAHSITAAYSGEYALAEGILASPLTQYVRSAVTKTVLATSGTPSKAGNSVTFTATVTANAKWGPIPNGEMVSFSDGSVLLGKGALAGGVATFATSKLAVGTHHILASYVGDNVLEASHGPHAQVVQ